MNAVASEQKQQKKKRGNKRNKVPSFLLKTYQILEDEQQTGIVQWSENGRCFVVKRLNEFTEKVLPKYFKHNNFASFVRQLNMYDFHKTRNSNNESVFYHRLFIRGQKHLLRNIKRKSTENANSLKTALIDDTTQMLQDSQMQGSNSPQQQQSFSADAQSPDNYSIKNPEEPTLPEDKKKETKIIIQTPQNYSSHKDYIAALEHEKVNMEKYNNYLANELSKNEAKQKHLEEQMQLLMTKNEEYLHQNKYFLSELNKKTTAEERIDQLVFLYLSKLLIINSNNKQESQISDSSTLNKHAREVTTKIKEAHAHILSGLNAYSTQHNIDLQALLQTVNQISTIKAPASTNSTIPPSFNSLIKNELKGDPQTPKTQNTQIPQSPQTVQHIVTPHFSNTGLLSNTPGTPMAAAHFMGQQVPPMMFAFKDNQIPKLFSVENSPLGGFLHSAAANFTSCSSFVGKYDPASPKILGDAYSPFNAQFDLESTPSAFRRYTPQEASMLGAFYKKQEVLNHSDEHLQHLLHRDHTKQEEQVWNFSEMGESPMAMANIGDDFSQRCKQVKESQFVKKDN